MKGTRFEKSLGIKETAFGSAKRVAACKVAVFVAIGLFYFFTADPNFKYIHDVSHFLGAAKSLLAGEGYFFNGRPETNYPPGWSLLLATCIWLFGDEKIVLIRWLAFCSVLCLIVCFFYYRRRGEAWGLWICVIIAGSSIYYRYSTQFLYSDIPYLLFLMLFLTGLEGVTQEEKISCRKLRILGTFLCFLMTVAIRSVSVALTTALGVTIFHQAISRRKMTVHTRTRLVLGVVLFGLGILNFLGWSFWTSGAKGVFHAGEFRESYSEIFWLVNHHIPDLGRTDLKGIVERVIMNVPIVGASIAETLTNIPWLKPLWFSPLFVLACFLVGVGWVVEVRRDFPLAAWYVLCYLGLILIWPFNDVRFVVAILPLILMFTLTGIRLVMEMMIRGTPAQLRKAGVIVGGLGVTGSVIETVARGARSKQDLSGLMVWSSVGIGLMALSYMKERFDKGSCWHFVTVTATLVCLAAFSALGVWGIGSVAFKNPERAGEKAKGDDVAQASDWLQGHTSPSAVIMADQYSTIHYFTGRRTVPFPITGKKDLLDAAVKKYNPDYLLVFDDRGKDVYYRPAQTERLKILAEALGENLKLVYEDKALRVFEFRRNPS